MAEEMEETMGPNLTRQRVQRFALLGAALLVGAVLVFRYGADLKSVQEKMSALNGGIVFVLLSVLPLVGFPATLLYVVAGAKFGSFWGLVVTALSIMVNLAATFWVTKTFLHDPLTEWFSRSKYRLPQVPKGEEVPITLFTALIPSAPYTVKNYLLPLAGIPFRIYFWICLPIHVFNASVGIFLGDFFGELTTGRTIFLISYGVVNIGVCYYVVRRLLARRKRTKKQESEESMGEAEAQNE